MSMTLHEIETKVNELVSEIDKLKKRKNKPVIGGTIEIAGIEWTALDKTDKGYLAITTNLIECRKFDGNSNNWTNSKLREYLNSDFYKKITEDVGEDNIIPFERDLLSLDGQTEYGFCEDKVSLLTVDEYRKYRKYLPNIDKWCWLCTPWSTPCNEDSTWVTVVSPSGNVSSSCYDGNGGVRPVCIFSSSIFKSEE